MTKVAIFGDSKYHLRSSENGLIACPRGIPVLDKTGGMNIVVVPLPGNTFLSLGHIGGDSVSLIEPDWIDHAVASPILQALTFILTVCIGTSQLLFGAINYFTISAKRTE